MSLLRFWGWKFAALTIVLANTAVAARDRPVIDSSNGPRRLLTDQGTLLRGVSLSWDGGDPFGSLAAYLPTQNQLDALASNHGLNAVHLYLEANSSFNNQPVGHNAELADLLVERTAKAGLYLILTIGNNSENGQIHDLGFATDFWRLYGDRYKDQPHVIYEAHNEPARFTPNQWTTADWNNQLVLYNSIRRVAPDTLVLLGSFMGFAGDPRYGADYLAVGGVDWTNAAFAHHGYESKPGIENALTLLASSPSYPAQLSTEFWPGDTNGQGYNAMYESHFNGWMQFQWLGGDDHDLHDFRSRIDAAGTVWTPDSADAVWPARGVPEVPASGSIGGLFSRGAGAYLAAASHAGGEVFSAAASQTEADWRVTRIDDRHVALQSARGLYLSASSPQQALRATAASIGVHETFEWIRLPNGEVVLRTMGGGGHLLTVDPATGRIFADADNARHPHTWFSLVSNREVGPRELVGDPFHGLPHRTAERIEAEDFDYGGPGVAYVDLDETNQGGRYRTLDRVDIQETSDVGGGYNVGWLMQGESLTYTVEIPEAAEQLFMVTARVAAPSSGAAAQLVVADTSDRVDFAIPDTGGWQVWDDVSRRMRLPAGTHTLSWQVTGQAGFNFNHFLIGQLGDIDLDGAVDVDDLDALMVAVRSGSQDGRLNLDGLRGNDRNDLAYMVNQLLEAMPGDVNLDRRVDLFDLVAIDAAEKYGSVQPAVWSEGDFNYDGISNIFDLIAIDTSGAYGAGNYVPAGVTATRATAGFAVVPEPMHGWLSGVLVAAAACRLQERTRSTARSLICSLPGSTIGRTTTPSHLLKSWV
jgi:hypothetical protein